MLAISKKLFSDLNENKINYCHFKSNEHLEPGLNGDTDLDVLFDVKQKAKIEKIFKKDNFKRFEPKKVGAYPGVENWYGFDEKTGKLIHIHTHYNLISGKGLVKDYFIPWEKVFLRNTILYKKYGVKIPDPNLEYILLCTRIVIKRSSKEKIKDIKGKLYLDKDYIKELDYLSKDITEESIRKYVGILFRKKTEQLANYMVKIKQLTPSEYLKYENILRKALRKYRRHLGFVSSATSVKNKSSRRIARYLNKKKNLALPLKKRAFNHGLSMAFVGIDGSGKSTVSTEIRKWLDTEFDVVKYYAGSGDGKKDILSTLFINTYKNNAKKPSAQQDDEIKMPKKLTMKKKIKNLFGSIAYYRITKSNIKNIKKSKKLSDDGCFCIMDRFPQSTLASKHDGPKLQRYLEMGNNFAIVKLLAKKERKIFNKIEQGEYPPYDLVFRMNVSPEVAFKRKPDHSYDNLKVISDSFKGLKYNAKKVVEIDSEKPLDEVLLKIKRTIWESL